MIRIYETMVAPSGRRIIIANVALAYVLCEYLNGLGPRRCGMSLDSSCHHDRLRLLFILPVTNAKHLYLIPSNFYIEFLCVFL